MRGVTTSSPSDLALPLREFSRRGLSCPVGKRWYSTVTSSFCLICPLELGRLARGLWLRVLHGGTGRRTGILPGQPFSHPDQGNHAAHGAGRFNKLAETATAGVFHGDSRKQDVVALLLLRFCPHLD